MKSIFLEAQSDKYGTEQLDNVSPLLASSVCFKHPISLRTGLPLNDLLRNN